MQDRAGDQPESLKKRSFEGSPPPSTTGDDASLAWRSGSHQHGSARLRPSEVQFSTHALRQARRRGISRGTLELLLECHDRSEKVPGCCKAIWASPERRQALVHRGVPAAEVERLTGIRIIIGIFDLTVRTVEHARSRRHWK